eukprot:745674-Hanusia_phi.AAC.4
MKHLLNSERRQEQEQAHESRFYMLEVRGNVLVLFSVLAQPAHRRQHCCILPTASLPLLYAVGHVVSPLHQPEGCDLFSDGELVRQRGRKGRKRRGGEEGRGGEERRGGERRGEEVMRGGEDMKGGSGEAGQEEWRKDEPRIKREGAIRRREEEGGPVKDVGRGFRKDEAFKMVDSWVDL